MGGIFRGFCFFLQKSYRLCVRNPSFGKPQIGHKLGKWQWCHNLSTWRQCQYFWRCLVSPFKLSYWYMFHVNSITGCGVMTIFFYKRLTRNPDIKFSSSVSNEIFMNAAKCQDYSFYNFWVGKTNVRRVGGGRGGYETMKSYILIFKIWTKRGVMKKLLRNRGLVEKEVLLEMVGVSKLFYFLLQFFGFFV